MYSKLCVSACVCACVYVCMYVVIQACLHGGHMSCEQNNLKMEGCLIMAVVSGKQWRFDDQECC